MLLFCKGVILGKKGSCRHTAHRRAYSCMNMHVSHDTRNNDKSPAQSLSASAPFCKIGAIPAAFRL